MKYKYTRDEVARFVTSVTTKGRYDFFPDLLALAEPEANTPKPELEENHLTEDGFCYKENCAKHKRNVVEIPILKVNGIDMISLNIQEWGYFGSDLNTVIYKKKISYGKNK